MLQKIRNHIETQNVEITYLNKGYTQAHLILKTDFQTAMKICCKLMELNLFTGFNIKEYGEIELPLQREYWGKDNL